MKKNIIGFAETTGFAHKTVSAIQISSRTEATDIIIDGIGVRGKVLSGVYLQIPGDAIEAVIEGLRKHAVLVSNYREFIRHPKVYTLAYYAPAAAIVLDRGKTFMPEGIDRRHTFDSNLAQGFVIQRAKEIAEQENATLNIEM